MTRSITLCIRRIKQGERHAWFQLWDRVWRWALMKASANLRQYHQFAEETASEIVLDVAQALERPDSQIFDRRTLRSFVSINAFHRGVDVRRNVPSHEPIAGQAGREMLVDVSQDTRLILEDLIEHLFTNPVYRETALLVIQGFLPSELAARYGVTTRTMQRRVSYIRQALSDALVDENV